MTDSHSQLMHAPPEDLKFAMRAYAYSEKIGLDTLRVEERPDPTPGPRDVVLRMRALTLNYRDLAIARGHYHAAVEPPLIPISDGAGEVIAVGPEVTRVCLGNLACPVYLPDWVDGPPTPEKLVRRLGGPTDGVMAEFVCLDERALLRAPSHLDAAEAACLPVAAVTAWHSLFEFGALRPGETIVILGTGGVSTAAFLFAKATGARCIGVTRREAVAERLCSLGADEVIVDSSNGWPKRVMELTKGVGANVILDVVGANSLEQSIAATCHGGLVHLVGYAAGERASFDIFEAIRHAVTIKIATAGSRRSFESLNRALEQERLRPPIERVFPVSHFRDAFAHLERGGHFGKVALSF
jgi:NADPH:quinone reductase-like Zn-dependent oxidoreductase